MLKSPVIPVQPSSLRCDVPVGYDRPARAASARQLHWAMESRTVAFPGKIQRRRLRCPTRMEDSGHRLNHQNGTGGRKIPAVVLSSEERVRLDEESDSEFYSQPRLGRHVTVDQENSLREIYSSRIAAKRKCILDLMTSYNSYLDHITGESIEYIDGVGLNEEELFRNPLLRERCVHDLNKSPFLPHSFANATYDCILMANGIQYLTHPEFLLNSIVYSIQNAHLGHEPEVDAEESVEIIISFTESCYKEKAISGWLLKGKEERIQLIRACFDGAGVQFVESSVLDFDDNEYLGVVIGQFPRTPVGRAVQNKQKTASPDSDIFADESDETNQGARTLSDAEKRMALTMAYEALAAEAISIGIPSNVIPSVEPEMNAEDIRKLGRDLKLMIQSFLSSGL